MGIHTGEKHIVLGLDPGRDKTGFAFVDGRGILSSSDTFVDGRGILSSSDTFVDGRGILSSSDTFVDGRGILSSSDTFVDDEGILTASGIFSSNESDRFFAAILSDCDALSKWIIEKVSPLPEDLLHSIAFIAIGNGTHSKTFTAQVRAAFSCEVITIDERNTTLEARSLYWRLHAPNFWVRLIPEGLRVPARVLDDLAAWAIAVRGLKKYRDINQNRL